jgi:hypothetical protein
MKPFIDVEANRINYHKLTNKNTVHRSSLIVPRFEWATSNISFINHFLLKRNNRDFYVHNYDLKKNTSKNF